MDVPLLVALWLTAAIALLGPGQLRAVVAFIVFSLLVALAWVRLGAPDLALAEAAIGAGISGVLLLDAVGHLGPKRAPPPPRSKLRRPR